ncbi:Fels-1 prophage protein [Acidovorax sp. SUPP2522]|uniref:hypothetical protein n=1 Tax=unclassified Acidovorax TaxID=2684926 RepID=UPI00234951B0|nr:MULTISPECIES: hypothetical protein [unclassified Acidovorax]WCM96263.1 hypothetical protein M5C96_17730 [Acidovorax sp. GBBC 1281]GKT16992.1 Fels-1 prophage protein [Acidovorax sp. SUPP2522]
MTAETTSRDNAALRALFSLPPIQPSTSTALTVPEAPAPLVVTGDRELDAVLWLRDCITTAHPVLIEKALETFKKVKTPADELEKRYTAYLARLSGNNFGAVLKAFGFADLESLAKSSVEKSAQQHDAVARFGSIENLLKDIPAETRCKAALRGLKRVKRSDWPFPEYDAAQADSRFEQSPDLAVHTLADCIFARSFGNTLYWLRHACSDNAGDHWDQFQEHQDYCFRSMARIPPNSKAEALAVLDYLDAEEAHDHTESPAILRNLVAGGWK